jgi:hypothetical protein
MIWGGKTLTVLVRQLSIDEVPLGLERATEDGISGFLGRRFEFIQGRLRLQRGDIGGWEVEGRKFGHLLRSRIVDATDQDTNMTHGALLGQYSGAMLPQLEPVPGRHLTQRLFVLTH